MSCICSSFLSTTSRQGAMHWLDSYTSLKKIYSTVIYCILSLFYPSECPLYQSTPMVIYQPIENVNLRAQMKPHASILRFRVLY